MKLIPRSEAATAYTIACVNNEGGDYVTIHTRSGPVSCPTRTFRKDDKELGGRTPKIGDFLVLARDGEEKIVSEQDVQSQYMLGKHGPTTFKTLPDNGWEKQAPLGSVPGFYWVIDSSPIVIPVPNIVHFSEGRVTDFSGVNRDLSEYKGFLWNGPIPVPAIKLVYDA